MKTLIEATEQSLEDHESFWGCLSAHPTDPTLLEFRATAESDPVEISAEALYQNLIGFIWASAKALLPRGLEVTKGRIESAFSQFDDQADLFPLAVRYVGSKVMGGSQLVGILLERPPRRAVIKYNPMNAAAAAEDPSLDELFEVELPWHSTFIMLNVTLRQRLRISMMQGFIVFQDGPLTSWDSKIYLPPLPNVYPNAKVCNAPEAELDDPFREQAPSLVRAISKAHDQIWTAGFNGDLDAAFGSAIAQARPHHLIKLSRNGLEQDMRLSVTQFLSAWESYIDPRLAVSLDWPYIFDGNNLEESSKTIGQLLERHMGLDRPEHEPLQGEQNRAADTAEEPPQWLFPTAQQIIAFNVGALIDQQPHRGVQPLLL